MYRRFITKFGVAALVSTALTIKPAPAQLLFDPPLDQGVHFGEVEIGELERRFIAVTGNPQNDILQRVSVRIAGEGFAAAPADFQIEAGQQVVVTVSFTPEEERDYAGTITFEVPNPVGVVRYQGALTGTGVPGEPPQIELDRDEVQLVVDEPDEIDRETIFISNTGGADLEFNISWEAGWLTVSPRDGVVAPGGRRSVSLRNNANLPRNGNYQERVLIESNDPDDAEVVVTVNLTVDLPMRATVISLAEGWNMISANRDFADQFIDEEGPDMRLILAEIIDRVAIIKDGSGRFCLPEFDFWGIEFWNTASGYQLKVTEDARLQIYGEQIPFDRPIDLAAGWNLIAYYPDYTLTMGDAFRDLVERDLLVMTKNGVGRFYVPHFEWGFDYVITPSEGIRAKVTEACSFSYPAE